MSARKSIQQATQLFRIATVGDSNAKIPDRNREERIRLGNAHRDLDERVRSFLTQLALPQLKRRDRDVAQLGQLAPRQLIALTDVQIAKDFIASCRFHPAIAPQHGARGRWGSPSAYSKTRWLLWVSVSIANSAAGFCPIGVSLPGREAKEPLRKRVCSAEIRHHVRLLPRLKGDGRVGVLKVVVVPSSPFEAGIRGFPSLEPRQVADKPLPHVVEFAVDRIYELLALRLIDPDELDKKMRYALEFTKNWDEPECGL